MVRHLVADRLQSPGKRRRLLRPAEPRQNLHPLNGLIWLFRGAGGNGAQRAGPVGARGLRVSCGLCDIAAQPDLDVNGDGRIDSCQFCPADFNLSGIVDPDDLLDFITCFFLEVQFAGTCPNADFSVDGFVNPDDLSDFITAFFLGC